MLGASAQPWHQQLQKTPQLPAGLYWDTRTRSREHTLVVGTAQALPSDVPISLRKDQKKGKELAYPLLYLLSTNVSKVPVCSSDKLP